MSDKITTQQVYDYLRRVLGRQTAYDLMESLEGDPEGYENLKNMIVSGELEPKKSDQLPVGATET